MDKFLRNIILITITTFAVYAFVVVSALQYELARQVEKKYPGCHYSQHLHRPAELICN